MSAKWKSVLISILKFAIGAVCGAMGISLTGCASVPVLFV